jgi:hypothetical protein
MMMALDGIHEPSIFKISVQFKEMFSQILWSFEILQIPGHVLSGMKGFAFGDV